MPPFSGLGLTLDQIGSSNAVRMAAWHPAGIAYFTPKTIRINRATSQSLRESRPYECPALPIARHKADLPLSPLIRRWHRQSVTDVLAMRCQIERPQSRKARR